MVLVNGAVRKRSFQVEPGDLVELELPPDRAVHLLEPAEIPLQVVLEDEHLLVVNKPRGLATHPAPSQRAPTLVNALLARSHDLSQAGGSFRPGIVHRLDKPTTGLLLVAKSDSVHRRLAQQIQEKTAVRCYFANVAGAPEPPTGRIEAPIGRDPRNRTRMAVLAGGKPARTLYSVVSCGERSLIAVRLYSGRTHQIRVHLSAIGFPVLGDELYAPKPIGVGALQLHAAYLSFDHPASEERIECFVEPPHDFLQREDATRAALNSLLA